MYPVIINGKITFYPHGLNKGISWRFCVSSQVRHETPEEGQRTYQPKCCEYKNEDEGNCPNILSDKNYQASTQKFKQKGHREYSLSVLTPSFLSGVV